MKTYPVSIWKYYDTDGWLITETRDEILPDIVLHSEYHEWCMKHLGYYPMTLYTDSSDDYVDVEFETDDHAALFILKWG